MNPLFILSDHEYKVINKIIRGCKMDCWAVVQQGPNGNDYICDTEWNVLFPLRSGVSLLIDGVGCCKNLDNCSLSDSDLNVLKELLLRLNVPNNLF